MIFSTLSPIWLTAIKPVKISCNDDTPISCQARRIRLDTSETMGLRRTAGQWSGSDVSDLNIQWKSNDAESSKNIPHLAWHRLSLSQHCFRNDSSQNQVNFCLRFRYQWLYLKGRYLDLRNHWRITKCLQMTIGEF